MTNLSTMVENDQFISDCARYAESILTKVQIERLYRHLTPADWDALGTDEQLVLAIQNERTRRIRSGVSSREKAALVHATKAVDVLDEILSDGGNSPRHRIEASKELRATAALAPEHTPGSESRFTITITLGTDVEHYSKSIAVDANDTGPAPPMINTSTQDEDGNGGTA
jgi:hypothetical protein